MSFKNISIETVGLHVGEANYARQTSQQVPYKKSGILTCGGISIFGDCSSIGGRAAVTIGTVDSVSKLPFSDSLYVLGTSKFFADMTVAASITVTKDIKVQLLLQVSYLILNIHQKERVIVLLTHLLKGQR